MSEIHPLRRYRDEHGLTQQQLGERIGVSLVTISRWETFAREPDATDLEKIVTATELPMEQIVRAHAAAKQAAGASA